ncbi:hypothetical protein Taro_007598 [Colocasia esculenta]|uniref:Uncharacterized protein n=1 Tax=Colocasia esculenta TaxID=4460 RepID=A0A843TUM1_COLES|nr:hypothetical protein [Colocasia esculenta]
MPRNIPAEVVLRGARYDVCARAASNTHVHRKNGVVVYTTGGTAQWVPLFGGVHHWLAPNRWAPPLRRLVGCARGRHAACVGPTRVHHRPHHRAGCPVVAAPPSGCAPPPCP